MIIIVVGRISLFTAYCIHERVLLYVREKVFVHMSA